MSIKPEVLFNRLTLLVQKDDERITAFQHELTPEPAPLFREGKIRKPAKNILRNHLLQSEGKSECPALEVAVIDGDDLLFHTSWNSKDSYEEIAGKYLKHIRDHFKQPFMLFLMEIVILTLPKEKNIPEEGKDQVLHQSISRMSK